MDYAKFKVLTFDCYGALIDWESGIVDYLSALIERSDELSSCEQILEAHAQFEVEAQKKFPLLKYSQLFGQVYGFITRKFNVTVGRKECDTYGNSAGSWPAFADSTEVKKILRNYS